MTTPNTIGLIVHGRYREAVASGIIKPGHMGKLDSDGKILKHATYGGNGPVLVAIEDRLSGYQNANRNIMDAYAVDDVVPYQMPIPGDLFLCRLPANASAVVVGDTLISNGDGTLVKPSSNGSHTLYASAAASTDVTNSVSTEQDFSQTYTVPANFLQVGDILKIKGFAVVSAAAGTDTLTVKFYIGSQLITATAAVNATTGDVVEWEINLVVRTIGASGTFVAYGFVANGVPGTATALPFFLGSTTIDTTATKVIKASATWSATTATCTVAIQAQTITIERVTPSAVLFMAEEAVDNSAVAAEAFIQARCV